MLDIPERSDSGIDMGGGPGKRALESRPGQLGVAGACQEFMRVSLAISTKSDWAIRCLIYKNRGLYYE